MGRELASVLFYERITILRDTETEAFMWEARAEYEDGTTIERLFCDNPSMSDEDRQYQLECWLVERHPGCVWYSVNWLQED